MAPSRTSPKKSGWSPIPTRWYSGCSFVDYRPGGHLGSVLVQLSTVRLQESTVPKPGENNNCFNWKGIPVNCGPPRFAAGSLLALIIKTTERVHFRGRQRGGRPFQETDTRLWHDDGHAADFDNDGWPDICVACAIPRPVCLFKNNHDGTFTRGRALQRGVALNEDGMEQAGMGLGVGRLRPSDGNARYPQDPLRPETTPNGSLQERRQGATSRT